MAKVTVVGDAVVITSALKFEEIEMVKKYRPEALTLKGGEDGKDPVFAVTTGKCGEINKVGACFSGKTRDENGYATITLGIVGKEPEDLREELADKYGAALIYIEELEETLPRIIEEIGVERANILDHIEIS